MPPQLTFDHLGLIVSTLESGRTHLAETLGITRWTPPVDDPGIGVSVQFGVGDSGPSFELIAPLGDNSPVAQALRTGQRTLNHLAYLTDEMPAAADHLLASGCVATAPAKPAVAYAGRPVQFFVSPLRFIIELIEAPGHAHPYAEPQ